VRGEDKALVDEARARAADASPAPWTYCRPNHWITSGPPLQDVAESMNQPNGEFVAHARTDVPALCDLATRQAEEIERLVAERDDASATAARWALQVIQVSTERDSLAQTIKAIADYVQQLAREVKP
jgi:hypothetical protein